MTVAIVEQSAIMFKSSIFFFHKFFTSVTRYFLVYLFAQGVNTHAYIKLYALFNRVRLKKKNTHKSLFSTTLVFAHHHHHHYVFLVGFFDGRRVGDHHARRLCHRDRGVLPGPRGNSNDKVPTFFFYVAVQFSRGNSRVQGAIKYVLYLHHFRRWTHWEERRSFSATMSSPFCASGSEEKAWSWTTRSRANASGRKTRLFVLRRHRHRRMSVGVKEPVCHVIMSR